MKIPRTVTLWTCLLSAVLCAAEQNQLTPDANNTTPAIELQPGEVGVRLNNEIKALESGTVATDFKLKALGLGGAKVVWGFAGESSPVAVPGDSTFVMRLGNKPAATMELYRLTVKNQARTLTAKPKDLRRAKVEVRFGRPSNGGMIELKPEEPLGDGEYVFSPVATRYRRRQGKCQCRIAKICYQTVGAGNCPVRQRVFRSFPMESAYHLAGLVKDVMGLNKAVTMKTPEWRMRRRR